MKRHQVAVSLGIGLLLMLVAAASRTPLFHESEPPVSAGLARVLVDFSIYLFLVVEVLVGVAVVWALWPSDDYGKLELKRRPWWHVLIQYAMLILVFGAGVLLANRYRQLLAATPPLAGGGNGLAAAPVPGTAGGAPPGFDWVAVGLVVALLAAVALALWQRERRRRAARRAARGLQRELAEVVGDALDDLRE
ncbi:MAG: hypothetical protein ABI838_08955, partial [Chloroflexota bacterium]